MGLGSFTFWYLTIFVLVVWMALRVGRSSSTMGVMTFLFWPISVVPLFTNWGDRDSDIRIPFVLTALASLMLIYNTNKAADQLALSLDADDIAYIRESDPETAAMIEQRQAAIGVTLEFEDEPGSNSGRIVATSVSAARDTTSSASRSSVAAEEMQFAAAPAQVRQIPLNELRFRRGLVRLGPAFASMQVPEHFRFVSAQQLGTLAEIRGVPVDPHSLGWVVHERVDLRSSDFWFVDVQFHECGHLAPPAGSSSLTQLSADDDQLHWDSALTAASWTSSGKNAALSDRSVVRLLRHGALLFKAGDLTPGQRELGLRATRMLALRAEPDPGWQHSEFIGEASAQKLASWVQEYAGTSSDTANAEAVESSDQRG
jgi:hypothetical protein